MKKLNRILPSLFFVVWSAMLLYVGWTTAPADRFTTVAGFTFLTSLIGYSLISSAIRSRKMRDLPVHTTWSTKTNRFQRDFS